MGPDYKSGPMRMLAGIELAHVSIDIYMWENLKTFLIFFLNDLKSEARVGGIYGSYQGGNEGD